MGGGSTGESTSARRDGRCTATGAAGGRCPAPASRGSWCEAHFQALSHEAEAGLHRILEETKATLSNPALTPARRRLLWAHMREVRSRLRLLGSTADRETPQAS